MAEVPCVDLLVGDHCSCCTVTPVGPKSVFVNTLVLKWVNGILCSPKHTYLLTYSMEQSPS